MPVYERAGATIYYEEYGSGFPLLLLAPGGLNSAIPFWGRMPLNPIEAFKGEYRVIAMDQRNAGRSTGPLDLADPWGAFADDQLGLLDHLGVERALVLGCCIGCSFIFKLVGRAPARVAAGALLQPIGVDETNPNAFGERAWGQWGQDLIAGGRSELTMDLVAAYGRKMFDDGFVFTATRDELQKMDTPMLLLYGNDMAHPRGISVEVAALLPNVELLERWRDPDVVAAATERLRAFLRANTPTPA